MSPRFREISLLYAFSAGLTALLAAPPALALWAWPDASSLQVLQQQVVGVERGLGFGLLTLCLILILRRAHRRSRLALAGEQSAAVATAGDGKNEIEVESQTASLKGWRRTALYFPAVFAPALPLLIYLWQFNHLAYANLFLGDQDFTNLSTAINQTARWQGFLTTPFLATGPTGSYLGHHFSPLLALYAPFYWLADALAGTGPEARPTHLVYAVCLWGTLALGLLLWARLVQKEFRNPFTATSCMALICGAYPLWRLALSYHYELPVIPLSALTFLALARWKAGRGRLLFWLWLILWMANKEDIALYVGLFAIYLVSHRGESPATSTIAHLSRTFVVGVAALAWLLLALWGMDWIGGPERVDWVRMWSEETPFSERSLRPGFFLLLACAFLPAINLRFFAIVLLPLLVFHYLSQQIWHHSYLGHYSYAILPFLFFGLIRGLQRLETGYAFWREATGANGEHTGGGGTAWDLRLTVLAGALACSFFAASADRYMPLPRLAADARFQAVESLLQEIPAGACLQTQSPFTAHTPLDVQVFPLMVPAGNPAHEAVPGPHNFERFYFRDSACRGYYLLLDPNAPMPPFYSQEHLDAFVTFAERNLTPVSATEEGQADFELRLYRLAVF